MDSVGRAALEGAALGALAGGVGAAVGAAGLSGAAAFAISEGADFIGGFLYDIGVNGMSREQALINGLMGIGFGGAIGLLGRGLSRAARRSGLFDVLLSGRQLTSSDISLPPDLYFPNRRTENMPELEYAPGRFVRAIEKQFGVNSQEAIEARVRNGAGCVPHSICMIAPNDSSLSDPVRVFAALENLQLVSYDKNKIPHTMGVHQTDARILVLRYDGEDEALRQWTT